MLPSGRPPEEAATLVQADPTWAVEYDHFKALIAAGAPANLDDAVWLNDTLATLGAEAEAA